MVWLQAYLASSSEEEEVGTGDAAGLRERYRALLLANSNGDDARTGGPKGRTWGGADPNSEGGASDSDAGDGDSDDAKVHAPLPFTVWYQTRKGYPARHASREAQVTPSFPLVWYHQARSVWTVSDTDAGWQTDPSNCLGC